jgi:hypothetical protein
MINERLLSFGLGENCRHFTNKISLISFMKKVSKTVNLANGFDKLSLLIT